MSPLKIIIAVDQFLVAEGLKSLISTESSFNLLGVLSDKETLLKTVVSENPDVIVIDHTCDAFGLNEVKQIKTISPSTGLLAITPGQSRTFYLDSMQAGIKSFLMRCCDREEIVTAINSTAKGEQFYCSKVLDIVVRTEENSDNPTSSNGTLTCEGINISEREEEIIRLIAEGNSNKEIADKLFLSPHTVNTHRKNIMSKLGVNNTAGIVIFAIKEQIISPNKFLFSAT
jgi:DNA-binding NarL/FixJ family response regulator